jgi:lipopolysaccharide/colanic/teichoic acid biosynthesis glycosyltransferase
MTSAPFASGPARAAAKPASAIPAPANRNLPLSKRILDVAVASLALAALSPVMLAAALAIKLTSPGPVLFRQIRVGQAERPFAMLKLRTMHVGGDDSAHRELNKKEMLGDMSARAGDGIFKLQDDARITAAGRFLRRFSIDELPQLFNVVFKGNLSLVGPRPHAVLQKFQDRRFDEAVDGYFARHRVKPGLTGWAQINGSRGEIDSAEKIQRRVELDLYYIENWSVLFDLYILAKTPIALLKTEHAY